MLFRPSIKHPRRGAAAGAWIVLFIAACTEQPTAPIAEIDAAQQTVQSRPANRQPLASAVWQEQARALVSEARMSPPAAARVYAALSIAQLEAITTGRDRVTGSERGRRADTERGAMAGAGSAVLIYFFPTATAAVQNVVQQQALLAKDDANFQHGLDEGKGVGTRMVERVKGDHFTDPWTGTVPVGPGVWRNNGPPALPMLGGVTPWLLRSGSQFRPTPPPAFGSTAFQKDLDEIGAISATRTPQQVAIAQFWNLPNGTPTAPGYFNELAAGFIAQSIKSDRAATHIFALLSAAQLDALIGCWEAKYYYWLLRPSQAQPGITLPIGLPNHPSYPSGHACVSSASTTVLAHFFPAKARELAAQLEEGGLSRMYAGIHYRFDVKAGEALGTSVGQWAIRADRRDGLIDAIRKAAQER